MYVYKQLYSNSLRALTADTLIFPEKSRWCWLNSWVMCNELWKVPWFGYCAM